MKKNKKIIITSIFIFLILCNTNLILFRTSESKYYEKKSLVYKNNLYNLYNPKNIEISIDELSNYKQVIIDLNIKRNSIGIKENDKDTYIIEGTWPEICTLSQKEFYYTGPSTQSIKATLNCNINNLDTTLKEINLSLKIKEKVNNEEAFTYINVENEILSIEEYYQDLSDSEITISKDSYAISTILKNWLRNTGLYNNFKENKDNFINAIEKYLEYYDSNPDILNSKILGINVRESDDLKNYIFSLEPNFIGYAITDFETLRKNLQNNQELFMYFSQNPENSLDEIAEIFNKAFNIYLEKYNYSIEDKNIVKEYLNYVTDNNKNAISDFIINNEPKINGLTRYKYNLTDGYFIYRLDIKDLFIYASNYSKNPIFIPLSTKLNMQAKFNNYITGYPFGSKGINSDLLSDNARTQITKDSKIKESLNKNATDYTSQPKEFDNYFLVPVTDENKNHFVMIRVYSDGTANYGDITKLNNIEASSYDISNENDSTLKVTINNGDAQTFINALKTYFSEIGVNIKVKEDSTSSTYIITHSNDPLAAEPKTEEEPSIELEPLEPDLENKEEPIEPSNPNESIDSENPNEQVQDAPDNPETNKQVDPIPEEKEEKENNSSEPIEPNPDEKEGEPTLEPTDSYDNSESEEQNETTETEPKDSDLDN